MLGSKKLENTNFLESYEGQLFKYTNVVKGWCARWFKLEPDNGSLVYFLNEQELNQKPRGIIELEGAVISPSDEDSHTFTISTACGDVYKLRASDAKERQDWVNRMRAAATFKSNKPPISRRQNKKSSRYSLWDKYASTVYLAATKSSSSIKAWETAHRDADKQLKLISDVFDWIQADVDDLPVSGELSNLSKEMIELNASSLLTLHTLQDAIRILENDAYRSRVCGNFQKEPGKPPYYVGLVPIRTPYFTGPNH